MWTTGVYSCQRLKAAPEGFNSLAEQPSSVLEKKKPLRHRNADTGVGIRPEHIEKPEKHGQVPQNTHDNESHT